jgi:hypothetical protein
MVELQSLFDPPGGDSASRTSPFVKDLDLMAVIEEDASCMEPRQPRTDHRHAPSPSA